MVESKLAEPGPSPSESLAIQRDALYRYVLTVVREPTVAEDLTQETLLRAHRRVSTLQDSSRLMPWLYRIATNVCLDRFRSAVYRHRPASVDADVESPADPAPRLDKLLEQKEMSACVQDYLAELPDSYRAVILLHDAEGLTNPEIASMLGISLPTVKIRLHRARAKLRETLAGACSFSTDERGVFVCDRKPD
jgi:RNA polymerase sigma-70 factor (ECF subfamily)